MSKVDIFNVLKTRLPEAIDELLSQPAVYKHIHEIVLWLRRENLLGDARVIKIISNFHLCEGPSVLAGFLPIRDKDIFVDELLRNSKMGRRRIFHILFYSFERKLFIERLCVQGFDYSDIKILTYFLMWSSDKESNYTFLQTLLQSQHMTADIAHLLDHQFSAIHELKHKPEIAQILSGNINKNNAEHLHTEQKKVFMGLALCLRVLRWRIPKPLIFLILARVRCEDKY